SLVSDLGSGLVPWRLGVNRAQTDRAQTESVRVWRVSGSGLFYDGGAPEALERDPIRSALAATSFTARLTAAVALRSRSWDAIVAPGSPSALACIPARKPLLAIAHGGDVHTLRRLHLLAPALHALRAVDARLVFASSELRELARAAAPSRWLDRS